MLTIQYEGKEYPLAANLRVAYEIQGRNNHKNYTSVLKDVGTMPLEKQIDIVYTAFMIANPEDAKTITSKAFFLYYLDNYDLGTLMAHINDITEGIMGPEMVDKIQAEMDAKEGNAQRLL